MSFRLNFIPDLKNKSFLDIGSEEGYAVFDAIKKGAKSVTAIATHGVLSDPAIDRIEKSNIKKVIITDTISVPKHKIIDKLKIVSVSNIFGQAVDRVHNGESVSALFEFQKGEE